MTCFPLLPITGFLDRTRLPFLHSCYIHARLKALADLTVAFPSPRPRTAPHALLTAIFLLATACSEAKPENAAQPSLLVASSETPSRTTSTTQTSSTSSTSSPSSTTTPPVTFTVALHPETEQRAKAWRQTLFVPYGPGQDAVGLSSGGDAGGSASFGPDSAGAVANNQWWIVDTAKHRVALFVDNELRLATDVEQELQTQSGLVTTIGHFLAPTKGGPILIDFESGERVEPAGVLGHSRRISGRLTEAGTFRTGSECGLVPAGFTLVVDRTTIGPEARLQSLVEALCSPDGVLHLLWYGYWTEEGQDAVPVSSYLRLRDQNSIEVEAIGDLSSERDPGTPARLSLIPQTNAPAIAIIGLEGVEGWVRESTSG